MEYKGFTYTLTPKTAWDSLSMLEKSEMMKVAVKNGITDLKTIKEKYNEFAKGGYLDWKEKANKYKHLDIDNDRTYDYEGWYNENPQRAWDFLNDSPDAHFDDKYKTVYHPTFSTQSKYSGKKDATYNPLGLIGGTWNKQGTVFTMSPDGYKGPVSMDERAWYLMNAEDNGVQLREADGSLPIFDGIPWGGVLPNVTVTGNKFAIGGDKDKNTPRPVTTGGAGYVPSMNQSAYRMVEKVGNLGKAAVKAGTKFIKDIVTQEPDAVRNAGIVYLQNLNPENRKVALDAVMHSSEGAHVMSGDAMLDTGLPNYVRAITGNPIQVNYTGSGIFDKSKRGTDDGYYRPNLKRDMVNLYLKGDTTGFEDVTDNPYYQNGPDYKKYFRENYPGLSPKTYKMSSDQVPLLLYPNEYEEAINSIGRNIPVEADGWTEGGDNVGHYNRWYKMIDGKLMAIDSDVWDFNPKDWSWMGGNTDDPELVNSVGTPFILKAIRPVQQIGYNQKPISPNKKHSIGGPIVEAAMNEYKNGGGIHIKKENRGKFTRLKERTGHSATWFKEHGTPAQKKMATFALNARHWKHGLGGNLFDGTTEDSQKMDKPNIFRRPNNSYFYQANPESEEVNLTPVNTVFDNPALWTFTDDAGRIYKPKQLPISNQDVVQEAPNKNRLSRVIDNYIGELKYDLNNGVPVGGKYTMPAIAAAAALPLVGEATYPILTNPFVDAGLTSAFAAHGLNHTINEGINGIGDAGMTALELAPMVRPAKAMYQAAKPFIGPIVEQASEGLGKARTFLGSPATGKWTTIGNRQYRLSPNTLGMNGVPIESRNFVNELPIDESRYYRSVDRDAFDSYKQTGMISQYDVNGGLRSSYSVPMFTKGKPSEYRIGINDYNKVWVVSKPNAKLEWESVKGAAMSPKVKGEFNKAPISDFDFYVYHPQKGYIKLDENLNLPGGISVSRTPHIDYLKSLSREEQIKYLTENGLNDQWLWTLENNPDHLESTLSKALIPDKTLHITPENAASITPEQWTAAQDAAIARGDMAEAQRLRDLHFKVSAPNTQIVDKNGNPIHSYHGTGKRFNEFDTTGKYSTLDEGYYGKGAYFAPNKELAQIYADTEKTPIIYDTYLNIKNPLRHVRDENADLYGKVITDNDGVISTLPDDLVDETFDMTEYVATKPNQIKSADAVTYDDDGVRIPLGKRDNFKLSDIRYGLLPFGIGLTGYGLFNNQEAYEGKTRKDKK